MDSNQDSYIFDFEALFEPSTYLYFQDALTDELTTQQVDFLIREMNLEPGMKILDLACGHGRHANKLAKLKYNVIGIDNNQGFLQMAQDEASKMKVSVDYRLEDMRKISFKNEFDAVILLVNEIGYFSDEVNLQVVKNIHNALKPNGLFCFDTINRDVIFKNFLPCIITEKDSNFQIDKHIFDPYTGRLICNRTYIMDNKVTRAPYSMRFYNFTEIRMILQSARFRVKSAFSNWDSSALNNESIRMIIVAAKGEESKS